MNRTWIAIATTVVAASLLTAVPAAATAPERVRGVASHVGWTVESRAAAFGIMVEWQQNPCGNDWSGCYDWSQPWHIMVRRDPDSRWTDYVILHELAHVRQQREGLPPNECDADRQAIVWGALFSGYECPGLVGAQEWYNLHG